ncbi:hypothetical protein WDW86_00810 [Bdellovibrionota bacterium FG-2]
MTREATRIWGLLVFCAVTGFGTRAALRALPAQELEISYTGAATDTTLDVFYDFGFDRKTHIHDSTRHALKSGNGRIHFSLLRKPILGLRLNPSPKSGLPQIQSILVKVGSAAINVDPAELTENAQGKWSLDLDRGNDSIPRVSPLRPDRNRAATSAMSILYETKAIKSKIFVFRSILGFLALFTASLLSLVILKWGKIEPYLSRWTTKSDRLVEALIAHPRFESLWMSMCGTWFLMQTLFFALRIKNNIPPDEAWHFRRLNIFLNTKALWFSETPEIYPLGALGHMGNLHPLLTAPLISISQFFAWDPFLALRLSSVAFSLGTFFYTFLLLRLLVSNLLTRCAIMAFFSNILMFTFISSAISYDALTNLLAIASVFHLMRFGKMGRTEDLFFLCLTWAAGAITKITFLPLIALELILLLQQGYSMQWHRTINLEKLRQSLKTKRRKAVLLVTLFFGIWGVSLYGRNLITYHALEPGIDLITTPATALESNAEYRTTQERLETRDSRAELSFGSFSKDWVKMMVTKTFGIHAHLNLFKDTKELWPIYFLIYASLFAFLFSYRHLFSERTFLQLLFLSAGYVVIVFMQNLKSQTEFRIIGIAVQGRYLFPVLAPLLIVLFHPIFSFVRSRTGQALLTLFTLVTGGYGGFIYFISNAGPEWFR